LALPEGASAQSGATLQLRTSFAAQYDTAMGWRPDYGVPAVHNSLAEPSIAAGQVNGGTRLLLGANNSIGNFFNALQGPDDVSNAQQDLASAFSGFPLSGFTVTQPQALRDPSPFQLPGFTETLDRYVIVAIAKNYSTGESRILISSTQYTSIGASSQCLLWFNVNDSPDTSLFADTVHIGTSGNALLITANMYSYSGSSFQYAKLWMFPKNSIYNDPSLGTCPAVPPINSLVLDMRNSDGSLPFSVIPAKSTDPSPTAYMVNSLSDGGGSLTVWVLDTTDPTVITGQYGPVSTNLYSDPPSAEQLGSAAPISMWQTRLSNAVYHVSSGLWTANTIGCTPAGDTIQRACVQYYQIDPYAFTTLQQGLVQLPGWHFYSPGIAANEEGDAVLGFNGSNDSHYVGMYFTGHHHTDPTNTVETIWQVKDGEGCFQATYGPNSLSTHSEATVDPFDDSVFWVHSPYVYGKDASCQNNDWGTGIAAVQFVAGSPASYEASQSGSRNGALAAAHNDWGGGVTARSPSAPTAGNGAAQSLKANGVLVRGERRISGRTSHFGQ
jgi:hypothetical protein